MRRAGSPPPARAWRSRRAAGLVVAAAVALAPACDGDGDGDSAGREDAGPSADLPAEPLGPTGTRALVEGLANLAGGSLSRSAITAWTERLEADASAVNRYIGELLRDPALGRDVASALLLGSYVNLRNYYAIPSAYTLSTSASGGDEIYYLRERCSPSEAVQVAPWWDPDAQVRVCPDAYRPERWRMQAEEHGYDSDMPLTCDGQVGSPEKELQPLCGCGPYLIRCMRDQEQYEAFNRSLIDEVKNTVRHVVQSDLPIETLFTANASFRDRNAELYYRRQRIGATRNPDVPAALSDLDDWPESGKWAPREELREGQQAGVLTSPQILHSRPDRRQRQRMYYEILWCSGRNSFGATTEKVFEVSETGNLAFVHDSWKRLAHTELCTNCHARLDYGFQFFMGYPDSRASIHFVPSLARGGKGTLYADHIDDPRGEAELTPRGFARLATDQPEFVDCMGDHVTDYVLGDDATGDDRAAIRAALAEQRSFKSAMRTALERYAAGWSEAEGGVEHAGGPLEPHAAEPSADETVAIGSELRGKLDKYCAGCHDGVEFSDDNRSIGKPFDFAGAELPRALVVRMVDQVAYGNMPEAPISLEEDDRRALVRTLIAALWDGGRARDEAAAYYLGQLRALPAQQIDNAFSLIQSRTGGRAPAAGWGLLERSIYSDQATYTPGYAATTGIEALEACVAAGRSSGNELEDCLEEATAVGRLSRSGLPHAE